MANLFAMGRHGVIFLVVSFDVRYRFVDLDQEVRKGLKVGRGICCRGVGGCGL